VNEQICAGCTFNKEENNCKRNLEWQWRGEMFPLSRKEFEQVKNQLEYDEENARGKPGYQPNTATLTYNEKLK
jgi:DNA polymerase epsilon subunit 1